MCLASCRILPSGLVLATLSEPARSTKWSLDLVRGKDEIMIVVTEVVNYSLALNSPNYILRSIVLHF